LNVLGAKTWSTGFSFYMRDLVDQGQQLSNVMAVRAGQGHGQWNAVAIGEEMMLDACFPTYADPWDLGRFPRLHRVPAPTRYRPEHGTNQSCGLPATRRAAFQKCVARFPLVAIDEGDASMSGRTGRRQWPADDATEYPCKGQK
jgi:hypothetical protein